MTTTFRQHHNSSTNDASTIIQSLLEAPVFLSADHALYNVLPSIAITIVAVTGIYLAALPIAHKLLPSDSKDKDNAEDNNHQNSTKKEKKNSLLDQRRRLAYQITNCLTNAVLGCLGLYFQYVVLPQRDTSTLESKIQGNENDLYLLGAIQIGFQIWSILMALLVVQEPVEMLIHHISVILASSKSVVMTNGFRYYAPMALGMTELSSVPLALMNSFKNNAHWRAAYPQLYLASRLVFSLAFLGIRIGLFVPQHFEYLQYVWLVTVQAGRTAQVGWAYQLYMGIAWLGSAFLMVLQLYWGWLIVNGLSKFALGQFTIKGKILDTTTTTTKHTTNKKTN